VTGDAELAAITDEFGEIRWRPVFLTLDQGKIVEIPCDTEADCTKKAVKATKRARRLGLTIEVLRGEGVLRLHPTDVPGAGRGPVEPRLYRETQRARRLERVRQREANRAARGGEGDRAG
jgi:hypothetical protein